jgi:hypothetical protein
MFKVKITARAKCNDCGATRKEQTQRGEDVSGIIERLRSKGWYIPNDFENEPCYCPVCYEQHSRERCVL